MKDAKEGEKEALIGKKKLEELRKKVGGESWSGEIFAFDFG